MSYLTKSLRSPVKEPFTEEYYRTNNYRDYLTRRFHDLAIDIIGAAYFGNDQPNILDFGCGYGGLLNAFHQLGYTNLHGTDISNWAIEEGKSRFPHIANKLEYYNRNLLTQPNVIILFLDVLEHMPVYEVQTTLRLAHKGCTGRLVARIPVCAKEGEPYVLPVSNNDPTHICCHTKKWWNQQFARAGFQITYPLLTDNIYDSPGVLAAIYEPH
jgi:SAM-dependent methyltransferase